MAAVCSMHSRKLAQLQQRYQSELKQFQPLHQRVLSYAQDLDDDNPQLLSFSCD